MNHSNSIIKQFKIIKKKQYTITIPLIIISTLLLISTDNGFHFWGISKTFVLILAFSGIALALYFSFTNWRCPVCNKYLGKNGNPTFCPKCGVQLQNK